MTRLLPALATLIGRGHRTSDFADLSTRATHGPRIRVRSIPGQRTCADLSNFRAAISD